MAHKEIDLKNAKTNRKNPGFTDKVSGCHEKMTTVFTPCFTKVFPTFYHKRYLEFTSMSYDTDIGDSNLNMKS